MILRGYHSIRRIMIASVRIRARDRSNDVCLRDGDGALTQRTDSLDSAVFFFGFVIGHQLAGC